MKSPSKSFSFFPDFDKEANNKLVSSILKESRNSIVANPLTLLIKAANNAKDSKVTF